jgi:hypothetical protein
MASNEDKNVSYLNKSFSDFKTSLQNYAKTYFPTTYNDFSESTPGNLFIEMASYVGDVTSFYLDTQVQENFLLYAKEKENLYAMSYVMGYRPKASYASTTNLDIYQLIPARDLGDGQYIADSDSYGLVIPSNTTLTSTNTGLKFLTTDQVDFTDRTNAEITFVDSNYYLFKKSVPIISAEIKTTTLTFQGNQKFATANITDTNVLQILSITGSDGNRWYEVPYLAQSSIFSKADNILYNENNIEEPFYLLELQKVPRRFVSRILSDNTLQLEFGAGLSSNKTDTQIIPTPDNIQLGLVPGISLLTNDYNNASVMFTQEYGLAPSGNYNVKYLVGGGITSNVPADDITTIDTAGIYFKNGNPGGAIATTVLASVVCNNPFPSSGGRNGDTIDEIRQNALNSYSTQLRAVTKEDYVIRALSMPSYYGNIAKAYISQDFTREDFQQTTAYTQPGNPLTLDLYILAYNSNKQLIAALPTLKQNLATYINQYRMVTDAINIRDAFYINIGVNFDIITLSGYANQDVLTNCISVLKDHFNIDKWQINQPIIISEILSKLLQVKGVQSVVKIDIINKQDTTGNTYSQYGYDVAGATKNGNVYPSLDPSIFEVRYPDTDIQGRVVVI